MTFFLQVTFEEVFRARTEPPTRPALLPFSRWNKRPAGRHERDIYSRAEVDAFREWAVSKFAEPLRLQGLQVREDLRLAAGSWARDFCAAKKDRGEEVYSEQVPAELLELITEELVSSEVCF